MKRMRFVPVRATLEVAQLRAVVGGNTGIATSPGTTTTTTTTTDDSGLPSGQRAHHPYP
jgi:hypothetical protein